MIYSEIVRITSIETKLNEGGTLNISDIVFLESIYDNCGDVELLKFWEYLLTKSLKNAGVEDV
jgi:hypothetical protein